MIFTSIYSSHRALTGSIKCIKIQLVFMKQVLREDVLECCQDFLELRFSLVEQQLEPQLKPQLLTS